MDMAESHAGEHHGPGFKAYMVVALALAIFTTVSFVVNVLVRNETLSSSTGFTIILVVAVCKALLVAAYFMHLVVDWGRLYYLIIPAFILGTMMMVVLLPDIVFAWRNALPPR
jgi:caa(3)-type oxidase subunit IV